MNRTGITLRILGIPADFMIRTGTIPFIRPIIMVVGDTPFITIMFTLVIPFRSPIQSTWALVDRAAAIQTLSALLDGAKSCKIALMHLGV
ncbi:hypothetical protein EH223_17725 [candidate division KSB1 bacterium]|nr:MAG: hypothetical protein EH223_17725 [candidate division KSB1 bacterium]